MARFPSWLTVQEAGWTIGETGKPEILVTVHVRKWHPGYWFHFVRLLLKGR